MDPKEVNEKLVYYFRPLTFPVAVKLLTAADELPEKAKVPSRDFGHKIMTCQAMAMARRHGSSVAVGPEDVKCAPSAIGLGLVDPDTLEQPEGPEAVSKTLELGKYSYFLYSPLHSTRFEPDVLVVYGNSGQIMRMVQALPFPVNLSKLSPQPWRTVWTSLISKKTLRPMSFCPVAGIGYSALPRILK